MSADDLSAWRRRLPALVIFVTCSAVLIIAYTLTPNTRDGLGTHKSLYLPPCGLYETTGIPCATCGMTTSFSLMAHGRFIAAFLTQPAGAMLALLVAMAAVISGYALVTGMSLSPVGRILWRPIVLIPAIGLLLAAWIYKIAIVTGWFGVHI